MKHFLVLVVVFLSSMGFSQCIDGDCFNGYGKFKCDCGYVFEGDFINGERVYGTLTKSDLVYTGEFKNELAHGFGKIVYADSTWYEGTFKENMPWGFGTFFFSDTLRYVGEIKNNEFVGYGTMYFTSTNKNHNQVELGQFKADQLNGFAFVKNHTNAFYFGFYEDGLRQGFGLKYDSEAKTLELGEFHKNRGKKQNVVENITEADSLTKRKIKIKRSVYSVVFDNDLEFLKITKSTTGKADFVAIYDNDLKHLYISSKESVLDGVVINMEGELFDAAIDSVDEGIVQIKNQKCKKLK
ncbi:MAG: hypothetical protein ACPGRC_00410 [Salibacteraceae bacterium]